MKAVFKDAFVLFAITLISGLLLGGLYHVNKEPIAREAKLRKEKAAKAVFLEAEHFTEKDGVVEYSFDGGEVEEVLEARDASEILLGYVITTVDHHGYGGDIRLMTGLSKDGTILGIAFLSLEETPGLGMKAKEEGFRSQFIGKSGTPLTYTKSGATAANEIDAISGATITTSSVTSAVNGALSYYQEVLSKEGKE